MIGPLLAEMTFILEGYHTYDTEMGSDLLYVIASGCYNGSNIAHGGNHHKWPQNVCKSPLAKVLFPAPISLVSCLMLWSTQQVDM